MSLTEAEVKKIAKLARIKLKEGEVDHFSKELSQIIDWIEMLQEVNTDNVPLMTSVANQSLPLRADECNDGEIQKDILLNAPDSKYGYFIVPKVVE